jgi:bacterioferritin-associated ferredoxin
MSDAQPPDEVEALPESHDGLLDRDMLVCRCEEVTLGEILDAINEGVTTPDGRKRRLRIGMGLCQGRTGRRLLVQVLVRYAGVSPAEVRPVTFRPPVRPIRLSVLADEREAPMLRRG